MYYINHVPSSHSPHQTAKLTLSHAIANHQAELLILLLLPFPFRLSFTISAQFAYQLPFAYTVLFDVPSIISPLQTKQSNGHCTFHLCFACVHLSIEGQLRVASWAAVSPAIYSNHPRGQAAA